MPGINLTTLSTEEIDDKMLLIASFGRPPIPSREGVSEGVIMKAAEQNKY